MAIMLVCCLGAVFVLDPKLGMPRDWDLFSFAGVPFVVLCYCLLFMTKRPMQPDSNGNVEILSKFWHFEHDPPELAPLLLIYADLLATGDARCIEAAEDLEGRLLDRFAG